MEIEEGQTCPEEDCQGIMEWKSPNCSCHLRPPCSSCLRGLLICSKCGFEFESGPEPWGSNNE